MNLENRPISKIARVGGRLCLDFVNTVGGRVYSPSQINDYKILDEKLFDYYDLLAWSQSSNLFSTTQIQEMLTKSSTDKDKTNSIFERAIILREVIYRICKQFINKLPPNPLDLKLLNQELSISYKNKLLIFEDKKFFLAWEKNALDKMLWFITDSMTEMLTNEDLSRLKECHGENCCWLFEDTSKNKMRQWCDMQTCGNVAKVRRFRSKTNKKAIVSSDD